MTTNSLAIAIILNTNNSKLTETDPQCSNEKRYNQKKLHLTEQLHAISRNDENHTHNNTWQLHVAT